MTTYSNERQRYSAVNLAVTQRKIGILNAEFNVKKLRGDLSTSKHVMIVKVLVFFFYLFTEDILLSVPCGYKS